jgi:small-conductance mechanosensitive channel
MVRLPAMVRLLLFVIALLAGTLPAPAQTPPAPPTPLAPPSPPATAQPLTAADAQRVLDVLRDPQKRAQVLSVLEGVAKALPAQPATTPAAPSAPHAGAPPQAGPAPSPAPPATGPPAAGPPATPGATPPAAPAAAKLAIPLAPNSLGAQILVGASARLSRLSSDLLETARTLTDFPLLMRWVNHVVSNRDTRSDLLRAAWKLAVLMVVAVGAERLTLHLLRPTLAALERRAPPVEEASRPSPAGMPERRRHVAPRLSLRRLPFAASRFAVDLVPLIVVAAIGYALLGTPLGTAETTRLMILAVLNAYLLTRFVVTATRALIAPDRPALRAIPLPDATAIYILAWVRRIAIIAVFGYAFAEVGLLFGLFRVAHDALLKLVALAVALCLVVVVLQSRQSIAERIRGRANGTGGAVAVLRDRLAGIWYIVAVFYILALWLVWALELPDGFARLLHVFVAAVVVLGMARLINIWTIRGLERLLRIDPAVAARHPGLELRARRYHPVARASLSAVIAAITLVVLFQAWGLDSFAWFGSGALGGRLVSALIDIVLTLLAALFAWEAANAAVQRYLARLTREAQAARSARLRTLLPMFRTALLVAICLVAALIVLSEIGVNIAPLLAGAGVVGLAIGFGSQRLVQDIITGLFLLLENTMQVGDVVTLGGLSGTVEALSIRTIRLRALDGSVHIIPFSAVTTVTNMTRDFGYAVLDISVGLNEEPDRVTDVVRTVAREMRAEPRWASAIRDDLEVLGVERFIDLAFVLRMRIQTLPGQRWAVARELNRRIKLRFDELAIESPITSFRALSATSPVPNAKTVEEAT